MLAKIFPSLAVINETIDPGPKLRVHWVVQIALPPEIKRQIGIEMGKDDAGQQIRASTFQEKGNLLGANLFAAGLAHVAMRADPGFDPVFLFVAMCADDNCAAGMVLGNLSDELSVLFQRPGLLAVNGEVDQ